jgi:hypothetical protein
MISPRRISFRVLRVASLGALLCASACGDDSYEPTPVDGFDPRLRGIYALESHTLNEAACEAGGDAASDRHALFAIDTINYHGRYLLGALSCADASMCKSHIEEAQAPADGDRIPELDVTFFFMFASSRSDGSASSVSTLSGSLDDGSCTAQIRSEELTHDGGQVRIESRITDVPSFAPSASGECEIPATAYDQPCNAFELVTGALTESL